MEKITYKQDSVQISLRKYQQTKSNCYSQENIIPEN